MYFHVEYDFVITRFNCTEQFTKKRQNSFMLCYCQSPTISGTMHGLTGDLLHWNMCLGAQELLMKLDKKTSGPPVKDFH